LKYLLDTNACIALINGKPASVRTRFEKGLSAGSLAFVSSVVLLELWYGIAKSTHAENNTQRLMGFLSGPVSILPFQEEDARTAGEIRAETEAMGRPVGAYDLLIAGQALRHNITVVTANTREFARIKNLQWEDWTKS
jgi:tRNA(fMet)-specific endonuclease VapC